MADSDSPQSAASELRKTCINTFSRAVNDYENLHNIFIQWALMLDSGREPHAMLISIFEREGEFSPVQESVTDDGNRYRVIGFIEEGKIRFRCELKELQGYFTEDGKGWIAELRVQDRTRDTGDSGSNERIDDDEDEANDESKADAEPETTTKDKKTDKQLSRRKKGKKSHKKLTPEKLRELQRAANLDALREAAKVHFGDRFATMVETVVDLRSAADREQAEELFEYDTVLVTRDGGRVGGEIQFLRGLPDQLPDPQ
ncbi:unnamed protein product [Zymoseptoria tritici ST99CH_3D7]|uniref:Uncharacterized protein n=1 Tax=Zymoseptoria tritici (strain ST99CH_3D7) TaxID=1276538 RepID=A0A1X7RGV0_ZYMT9|nr:unnamed protein product [Zymoseptoria tritici ST99CH_3D7]